MKRKLPSLLAVRYFEAVGRNLSFTLAAAELNVTQAAVSHQIRLLEMELGVKLFSRLHQRIQLTREGLRIFEAATECLDQLADAFDEVSGREHKDKIQLSVTPLVSTHVLMPKLGAYLADKPGTDIVMHHSLDPPSDAEPAVDIKIFFSDGPLNDSGYQLLFIDKLAPICTPRLIGGRRSVATADVLGELGIIHEFNHEWWATWCRRAGLSPELTNRGVVVDDPAVLENAALHGNGIILGSLLFLRRRLKDQDLMLAFGEEPALPIYYYLALRASSAQRRSVRQFRDWIVRITAELKPDASASAI